MTDEHVSIIMPVRNSAKFIEMAISSICEQKFSDWKLYVIDDASTDDTVNVVKHNFANEKRIEIITLSQHQGVASARNIGLERAVGSLIAFLDSDDLWHPRKLELQVKFMFNTGTAITYAKYQRIDSTGHELNIVEPPASVDFSMMLKSNFIGNLTAVFDRRRLPDSQFANIGSEDYFFWLENLRNLNEPALATPSETPLASYRVGHRSLSSNKVLSAYWQWKIYSGLLGLGIAKSCWYMLQYTFYGLAKRWPWLAKLKQ